MCIIFPLSFFYPFCLLIQESPNEGWHEVVSKGQLEYIDTEEEGTTTTPDSYCSNRGIFTVGVAGVGGAPTVGVLGPSRPAAPTDGTVGAAGNLSRSYSWG